MLKKLIWNIMVDFRTGRSTVDAVMEVVNAVHRAEMYSPRHRWIVLLVMLDIRNVFNPIKRADILGTLENC